MLVRDMQAEERVQPEADETPKEDDCAHFHQKPSVEQICSGLAIKETIK